MLHFLQGTQAKHDPFLTFFCKIIVFVWSQYDGGNTEQRTIAYGCRQNQEAKLKNFGSSNSLIQPARI